MYTRKDFTNKCYDVHFDANVNIVFIYEALNILRPNIIRQSAVRAQPFIGFQKQIKTHKTQFWNHR